MSYLKLILPALFVFTGINGQVLLREGFENNLLETRGWNNATGCRIAGAGQLRGREPEVSGKPNGSSSPGDIAGPGRLRIYTDSSWISDDMEKRFTYGLNIDAPWESGGTLFIHFPEHLEYNPVGNTILRHYDSIPLPWIISPDGKQASYRVESPALKGVVIESFVRKISAGEIPLDVEGVKLAMHITNHGSEILPVIRPLICVQYSGLTGFPGRRNHNFEHSFIMINGELKALADLATSDPATTFKGCVVRDCPQNDTRAESMGGLIQQKMDLALSVVTALDNKRKIVIWWTPGKSMIANANIPCMHADPYFGTLKPGEDAYAEGMILFTDGNPAQVIRYLEEIGRKAF